jgi:type IV secretory pathway TrbF-like protein
MAKSIVDNPYAQSLALWDDLYGSVQLRLQNAYRVIACLSLVLVVTIVGLTVMSFKSNVKPYVALLRGDELITVKSFQDQQANTVKPQLAMQLVKQFITSARSVSLDPEQNQHNHVQAYSYIGGSATDVLKAYFASRQTKDLQAIQITTVLMKSPHVMDIRWKETRRNRSSGETIASEIYSAEITFSYQTPSQDLVVADHNPFGFYITSLAWARDRATQ